MTPPWELVDEILLALANFVAIVGGFIYTNQVARRKSHQELVEHAENHALEVEKQRLEIEKIRRSQTDIGAVASHIQAQLLPDHGGSTRDAIDRVENSLRDVRRDVRQLSKDIDEIKQRDGHVMQSLGRLAESDDLDRDRATKEHLAIAQRMEGAEVRLLRLEGGTK